MMKCKNIIINTIFFSFLLFSLHSGDGLFAQDSIRAFTLEEAQTFALENNLNLRNARLEVEQAKKVVWENLSLYLPQVNSGVSYNNNLSLQTSLIPAEIFGGNPGEYIEVQFGTQHNTTASITATQIIINMPYIIGLQAANIFKSLSVQTLEKTEIEVKELIAQNYYLALLAEESYEIINNNYQMRALIYEAFTKNVNIETQKAVSCYLITSCK